MAKNQTQHEIVEQTINDALLRLYQELMHVRKRRAEYEAQIASCTENEERLQGQVENLSEYCRANGMKIPKEVK